jgi:hypothetical protein
MSAYRRFGLHDGHLTAEADLLAQRHACTHRNYVDRGGQRNGWFCTADTREGDRAAERLLLDLKMRGGIAALRAKNL